VAGLGEAVERNGKAMKLWMGPEEGWVEEGKEAPTEVEMKERLPSDIEALEKFFGTDRPPLRVIRGRIVLEAFYGFGNASGTGYGASFDGENAERVYFRFGQWCTVSLRNHQTTENCETW
jgi:hypothetical protein